MQIILKRKKTTWLPSFEKEAYVLLTETLINQYYMLINIINKLYKCRAHKHIIQHLFVIRRMNVIATPFCVCVWKNTQKGESKSKDRTDRRWKTTRSQWLMCGWNTHYSNRSYSQINMDAPLWDCTIVEQHAVARFLQADGDNLLKFMVGRMLAHENSVTHWKLYE